MRKSAVVFIFFALSFCLSCGNNGLVLSFKKGEKIASNGQIPTDPEITSQEGDLFSSKLSYEINLLPYQIRKKKVASLLGIAEDDPLFSVMNGSKFLLGAYDAGKNSDTDQSWNSDKLYVWISALKPLCESSKIKNKYLLPQDLEKFVADAYGRHPSFEEIQNIRSVLAEGGDAQSALCIAVLSSTEFVGK